MTCTCLTVAPPYGPARAYHYRWCPAAALDPARAPAGTVEPPAPVHNPYLVTLQRDIDAARAARGTALQAGATLKEAA